MTTNTLDEALAERFSRLAHLARELGIHDNGRTHWEGCEERHFGCALAKLREAEEQLEHDRKLLAEVFDTTHLTPRLAAAIAERLGQE